MIVKFRVGFVVIFINSIAYSLEIRCRHGTFTRRKHYAHDSNFGRSLYKLIGNNKQRIPSLTVRNVATDNIIDSNEDKSNNEISDNEKLKSAYNRELVDKLDEAFTYKGRLNSGDKTIHDLEYRCGFACIIGAPNVGKSTLMNALLQENLCITTSRPQTTRHAILGIVTTNTTQLCLIDTPGVIDNPAYKLQDGMMEAVIGAFHDADVLLIVTDLFSTPIPSDEIFRKVQLSKKPKIVAVNKIDLQEKVNITKNELETEDNRKLSVSPEEAIALWRTLVPDAIAILPMSAGSGISDTGVTALRNLLTGDTGIAESLRNIGRPMDGMFHPAAPNMYSPGLSDEFIRNIIQLPLSPPLYDTEVLTDRTERFVASEIIRSVLFTTLKKELPYCCEVQISSFKEPRNERGIHRISADVLVERDSQKVIVIGKDGEQIKQIGIAARMKLQEFLQNKVRINPP
jgi:small GTP-binding protein